jgi:hypothetical protein
MSTLRKWITSLLVLAITAVPVMAESDEGKTAKDNSTNASSAEATPAAANPNLAATPGDANVTALLGVLVTKGVLAPNEASAIRNASPNAQFQALVEALSRKGIVSAADLSAVASPAAQPAAPAVAPVEAGESVSSSVAGPEASPQAQTQTQPQPPLPSRVAGERAPLGPVAPAIAPVRVFPVDAPKTGAWLA